MAEQALSQTILRAERNRRMQSINMAWASAAAVGGVLYAPFLLASTVFATIAGLYACTTPLIVGFRRFGRDELEQALNSWVYEVFSKVGRLVVLFDQDAASRSRAAVLSQAAVPTSDAQVSLFLAAIGVATMSWRLDVATPSGAIVMAGVAYIGGERVMRYWANGMLSRAAVSYLTIVSSFWFVRRFGLWMGAVGWLSVYASADYLWTRWYISNPPTVDSQTDVRHVEASLRHASLRYIRSWAAINRFSLWCDDTYWRQTVAALLKHASAVLIDVSDPTDNLRWEIGQARSTKAEIIYSCHRAHRAHAVAHLGEPIDWERVLYYPAEPQHPGKTVDRGDP